MQKTITDEYDGESMSYYTFQSLGPHGPDDWRDHGQVRTLDPKTAKEAAQTYAFEHRIKTRVIFFEPKVRDSYIPVIDRV